MATSGSPASFISLEREGGANTLASRAQVTSRECNCGPPRMRKGCSDGAGLEGTLAIYVRLRIQRHKEGWPVRRALFLADGQ